MASNDNKCSRIISTHYLELFQDKEVQASFEEDESNDAPVLVYYSNYSLPDLSFLPDILSRTISPFTSLLSNMCLKRCADDGADSSSATDQCKCMPESYTDYETLFFQYLCEIKDWNSMNLLLPDDFDEFIENNTLMQTLSSSSEQYQRDESSCQWSGTHFGRLTTTRITTSITKSNATNQRKDWTDELVHQLNMTHT